MNPYDPSRIAVFHRWDISKPSTGWLEEFVERKA
jgi:hypothetical protein